LIKSELPFEPALRLAVEKLKETLPDKGKWSVLVPLSNGNGETWHGEALNIQGKKVRVYYDNQLGLRTESE